MSEPEQVPHGTVSMDISTAVVRIVRSFTGRGPTKARTTISEDLVTVVLRDSLLKAERSLVAAGDTETVMIARRRLQAAMRDELVDVIESAVGRPVASFMSDHDVHHDIAVKLFVLEPPPAPEDAASTHPRQRESSVTKSGPGGQPRPRATRTP